MRSAPAVICGSLAVLALLAWPPGGNADELSNLRADSARLQQRIAEINRVRAGAASTAGSGTGGTADAPVATGVVGGDFPRSFLIPGTDTSVSVGGSVNENMGWTAGRPADGR